MKTITIRSILALLIILLCFSILFYALIKYGADKGTLNLVIGAAITGISLIGGYYFQSSHKPVGGVTDPTSITDIHTELKPTQDELPTNPGGPVQPV